MSSPTSASSPSPASGAVFLSYASQDAETVRRIGEVLQAAGIEVWFDQDELVGGDAWDAKIRKQIKDCALFVPVISAATQARLEGYFRLEWKLAAQRSHTMAEAKPFLLPVVIDATRDAEAHVPEEFRAVQWTRLPGGEAGAAFCAHMRSLLGGPVGMETGRPRPALRDGGVASPATPEVGRRVPAAAWMIAILVLAGAGAFLWQQSKPEPATATNAGAGTRPPTSEKSDAPRLGPKSIAVLPFDNLSEDKEAGTSFADGMHDDLITNLLLIREVRCVPRTTAMTYRGTKKTNREIAEELGVAFLLTGTVRRADKDLRITGTLINARSDEALWSKPYNKVITDAGVIFAIQSELAQAIAGELKATLSPQEKKLVERRPTENTAAYDLYVQARALRFSNLSAAKVKKAEALLEAAIALDSKFALAWAELSYVHGYTYVFDIDHTAERAERAKLAIDNAVRLAPEQPEIMLQLAYYNYFCSRDYDRANALIDQLIRAQPNAPDPLYARTLIQRRQGKWKEVIDGFHAVVQLDPGNADCVIQLYGAEHGARKWDQAAALRRRTAELRLETAGERDVIVAMIAFRASGSTREMEELVARMGSDPSGEALRVQAQLRLALMRGDLSEIVRLNAGFKATEANLDSLLVLACALAAQGKLSEVRALLEKTPALIRARLKREPFNASAWVNLGMVEAMLGNGEAAVRCARKGVEILPEALDAWTGPRLRAEQAFVYAWAGDKEKALAEYAHLLGTPVNSGLGFAFNVSANTVNVHTMRRHPFYFPLQGDPRFEALLNDPKNNAPLF